MPAARSAAPPDRLVPSAKSPAPSPAAPSQAILPAVLPDDAAHLKSTGGLARIGNAWRYSMQGFGHALRHEAAFRQELLLIVPALVLLIFLPLTMIEKIILLGTSVLVLMVELLNSAIEAVVDRISTERHPLAGRAKDLGSAAVFLALTLMAIAWLLLAGPLLLSCLPLFK